MFAVGIIAAHFLLAAGFMLYFFHVPETIVAAEIIPSTAAPAVVAPVSAAAAAASVVAHAVVV